jgi:hypothetical protein
VLRMDVARAHSTDALGQRLEDVLKLLGKNQGQIQ